MMKETNQSKKSNPLILRNILAAEIFNLSDNDRANFTGFSEMYYSLVRHQTFALCKGLIGDLCSWTLLRECRNSLSDLSTFPGSRQI